MELFGNKTIEELIEIREQYIGKYIGDINKPHNYKNELERLNKLIAAKGGAEYKPQLTIEQKIAIVSNSEEVMAAVKLLIVVMEDCELKKHITTTYTVKGETYQLSFTKITPEP